MMVNARALRKLYHREEGGVVHDRSVLKFTVFSVEVGKLLIHSLLLSEQLHDVDAGDELIHEGIHCGNLLADQVVHLSDLGSKDERSDQQEGQDGSR